MKDKFCKIHQDEVLVERGKVIKKWKCKLCEKLYFKKWYSENKEAQYIRIKNNLVKSMLAARLFVLEYFKQNPCIDCGNNDPDVLEFDHIDPEIKVSNIGKMISRGFNLKSIKQEIVKCEVRCANCHRRKTRKQFGWFEFSSLE